ncbi:unnamed protein product [Medioppia subpectinata]|uniref:TNFR-Cys domain-containing protein n=1 Tax=Medioppia subpectinata TaxID=1979941 RepID=A0A7R9KQQ3_9ACAR|nr:unnamed protein product [Medioppia subpectinata]CAG2107944.1 unnamed protein product [Medioppia subpectinata]
MFNNKPHYKRQVPDRAQFTHHKHRHQHDLRCHQCPPGHYVKVKCDLSPGTTTGTQCAACPPNTYQPHNSYKSHCESCSKCGEGLYASHTCSPTADTVCNSCQTQRPDTSSHDYRLKCL